MIHALELKVSHSSFLHCQVVSISSAKSLGRVSAVWLDLINHKVLGFSSRVGFWDTLQTYPWRQIVAVEDQTIKVKAASASHPSLVLHLEAESWTVTDTRLDLEVWTHRGRRLGNIADYTFDPSTGIICEYLCAIQGRIGLAENLLHISPDMIMDAGQGWLLVPDEVMQQVEPEAEPADISPSRAVAL
ncbi:MAG: PRC-barrel domain-containing protein [Cyanobacteria bacterium P01_A01_bin.17]